jgi:hypothetical protein
MHEKMAIIIQRKTLFHIKLTIKTFLVFLLLPSSVVVTTLLNFVRMFIRAHGENCKQTEYDKKKAEKEAEQKMIS